MTRSAGIHIFYLFICFISHVASQTLIPHLFLYITMSYNALKVADLKSLLQDRGLSTAGTKPALIARLEEADAAGNTSGSAPAPAPAATSEPAPTSEAPTNTASVPSTDESTSTAPDPMAGLSDQDVVVTELETRAGRARKMDEALAEDLDRKIKRVKKFGVPDTKEFKDILRLHGRLPPLQQKSKQTTEKPVAPQPTPAVPLVDEDTLAKRRQRFA